MCLERFVRCKDRKQITGDRTIENKRTVSKSDPLALRADRGGYRYREYDAS